MKIRTPLFFLGFCLLFFVRQAPANTPANKLEFLIQNHLYQIIDLSPEGHLIMNEIPHKKSIKDDRFQNLPAEKIEVLKEFFVGKFIKIEDATAASIELPIELYSPLCFSSQMQKDTTLKECPVVLEP